MISSHHWTGPAEQVLTLSSALVERGHQVDVAVGTVPRSGNLPGVVRERGLDLVEGLSLYRRRFAPRLIAQDLRWLKTAFDDRRYDVVHCHHSNDHTLALIARGRRRHLIPIVRTVHHSTSVKLRPFQTLQYRFTDGFIAISDAFGEGLRRNYRLAEDRIRVVRSTVDAERFRPPADRNEARGRYGFSPAEFLIGIVSRIKAGRGHPELIEAFSRIASRVPDARLVIVGRGEMRSEMEYEVRRFGLEGKARFLGYIGEDLPAVIGMLDLKMMLGEGSDGSCRAAVEAMACGVPVVAAPVGTMPETVESGHNGLLLSELSVDAIACAIRDLTASRERLPEMGRAAREDVERRFTEDSRAPATIAYFESFLDR